MAGWVDDTVGITKISVLGGNDCGVAVLELFNFGVVAGDGEVAGFVEEAVGAGFDFIAKGALISHSIAS